MKATQFEFRFRIFIIAALYSLGFWAPWTRYGAAAPDTTAWLALTTTLANWHWLPLDTASVLITSLAIVFAFAGAALRVSGTAYLGASTVQAASMQAGRLTAAGPYRHLRNPLYLGSLMFSLGVAILMPPSGAAFFLIAAAVFYFRLILAEETWLASRLGTAYDEYRRRVPWLLPSLRPRTPPSPVQPQWLQGLMAELFPVVYAVCLAILAWRYDPRMLIRCLLIGFGLSLVARAMLPASAAE